ncbi:methyltransferase domain-containing protein [Acuticoccus sp. M5D2P5]|uniref:class I SAM-dependent methyltransferase n=1 Tax=Acuticoccus kalidii TaxID=2910977 RepID=UPI001F2BE580|nr:class I SAM-dependent methyltransferase [Acuticoccus kalidii]MCF3934444.1 methyltransferase domain-containing protein [Acuticoccus kalidii]
MSVIEGQTWSAHSYEENARFVSDLGTGVFEWLDPQPGERILDLGCGDGALTERLVAAGAVVVGVDGSPDFVDAAKARGIDARLGDGHELAFESEFDAVFSNAALHWMTRPAEVAAGVRRALKAGGRFVGEFGGHTNVAAIVTALHAIGAKHGIDPALASPWYFPTPDAYAELLSANGFSVERIALIPRPTPLPTGLKGWVRTFRQPFFDGAGDNAPIVLNEIEELLSHTLRDEAGRWTADYVRLRFIAKAV